MGVIFQKPPNNYQALVGLPNVVDYDLISEPITGVATTTVGSLILPPRAIVQDGQRIFIRWVGTAAGAAGNRVFSLTIGGSAFQNFTFNVADLPAGQAWIIESEAMYIGANVEIVSRGRTLQGNSVPAGATIYKEGRNLVGTPASFNPNIQNTFAITLNPQGAGDVLTKTSGLLWIF